MNRKMTLDTKKIKNARRLNEEIEEYIKKYIGEPLAKYYFGDYGGEVYLSGSSFETKYGWDGSNLKLFYSNHYQDSWTFTVPLNILESKEMGYRIRKIADERKEKDLEDEKQEKIGIERREKAQYERLKEKYE